MPITRERLMRYKTSDGKTWDSHADAIGWEKRLILLACLRQAGVVPEHQARAVETLLASPSLIIALAGPSAKPPPRQQDLLP